MEQSEIEDKAMRVLQLVWKERHELWPQGVPEDPVSMLDPECAAHALGYQMTFHPSLGRFGSGRDQFETAGAIDRQRRVIAISQHFHHRIQRFTAAHELGHLMLHPHAVMHRDRPVSGEWQGVRPVMEREADKFAGAFLAPRRLLTKEFCTRFRCKEPLLLNDTLAYHLAKDGMHDLLSADADSLAFETQIARARSLDGRQFTSLADTFGLSVGAMAIRIRELGLVTY